MEISSEKWKWPFKEILPYVDEHYWLPLYGQAGLTSGANGTVPVAGNPGRLEALRADPLLVNLHRRAYHL